MNVERELQELGISFKELKGEKMYKEVGVYWCWISEIHQPPTTILSNYQSYAPHNTTSLKQSSQMKPSTLLFSPLALLPFLSGVLCTHKIGDPCTDSALFGTLGCSKNNCVVVSCFSSPSYTILVICVYQKSFILCLSWGLYADGMLTGIG
jgi:hypothetical protein